MVFDHFTVLITGANRGLGYGLALRYLLQPNTTVIAAVRNPETAEKIFRDVPTAPGTALVIISTDCTSSEVTDAGIHDLLRAGCRRLDLVIANAGQAPSVWAPCTEMDLSEVEQMIKANGLGPLLLFRAAFSMMLRSAEPRFVYISSLAASFSAMEGEQVVFGAGGLGVGKAVGNFLTRKLAFENKHILSFMIDPGVIGTDGYLKVNGTLEGTQIPDECADKIFKLIDGARPDTYRGKVLDLAGEVGPW